ncbi:MAG TPA: SBBP repeat-containing protein [Kiritimatiellia bacterium]|nr:SBBP repeat-containing protein [Kiritimatiellia bacterium]
MKINALWAVFALLFAAVFAAQASVHHIPTALKIDPRFPFVYIAGSTTGDSGGENAGHTDIWLAKYTTAGQRLWLRQFGSDSSETPSGLAVDGSGFVYLAGHTMGSLDGQNLGGHDAWVARFSPTGQRLWTRHIGSGIGDGAEAIAADAAGNTYVVGHTVGAIRKSAGGQDAWLARLNKNGAVLWVRQFGTKGDDMAYGVAIAPDGSAVVTGYTEGPLAGAHAGGRDIWVARFNALGLPLWARQYGSAGEDIATDVSVDDRGGIGVVGYTDGALAGPRTRIEIESWMARHTLNGNRDWIQQFGTAQDELALAVAATRLGIFTGGYGYQANGHTDAWIARWSPSGALAGALTLASGESEILTALDADANGNVYAALEISESDVDGVHFERQALLTKFGPTGSILWSRAIDSVPAAKPLARTALAVPDPAFSYSVTPSSTDGAINKWNSAHLVFGNSNNSKQGRLVVFFAGSYASPADYTQFLKVSALQGYHTIGLSYPNAWTVNQLCQSRGDSDPGCFDAIRGEIFTGDDLTSLIDVNAANSISNRLYKLLVHLHAQHPAQGWDTWFDAGTHSIDWSALILGGHSQGGGHAGYIAKQHAVARAIMVAAPEDQFNNGLIPGWLQAPSETDPSHYFGFNHINDSFYARNKANWQVMGMNAYGGLTNVDTVAAPFGHSHQLITSAPPAGGLNTGIKCHNSPIVDQSTPMQGDNPFYGVRQAWQYLVNTP